MARTAAAGSSWKSIMSGASTISTRPSPRPPSSAAQLLGAAAQQHADALAAASSAPGTELRRARVAAHRIKRDGDPVIGPLRARARRRPAARPRVHGTGRSCRRRGAAAPGGGSAGSASAPAPRCGGCAALVAASLGGFFLGYGHGSWFIAGRGASPSGVSSSSLPHSWITSGSSRCAAVRAQPGAVLAAEDLVRQREHQRVARPALDVQLVVVHVVASAAPRRPRPGRRRRGIRWRARPTSTGPAPGSACTARQIAGGSASFMYRPPVAGCSSQPAPRLAGA